MKKRIGQAPRMFDFPPFSQGGERRGGVWQGVGGAEGGVDGKRGKGGGGGKGRAPILRVLF